ncbi:MAG: hypothetical protein EBT77_04010 [Verrucomicrobia bacterium]|nr:hypothetical protein [Verrucomicrobiota bacterium]
MDGQGGCRHRSPMAGRLMTQAELMAWEHQARRWVLVALVGVATGIFGFGLLTMDVSYRMLKRTPVMTEALARISADPRVAEILGRPLRTGWSVGGELDDLPDRGNARMDFRVFGSKGQAKVRFRAEKTPAGIWRFLLLEVEPSTGPAFSCADR